MNALSILLLKKIEKFNQPFHRNHLVRFIPFSHNNAEQFQASINFLIDNNFIDKINDNEIFKNEKGKNFLNKYDLSESEEVYNGNLRFAILKFLFELNEIISIEALPELFKEKTPEKYYSSEENLAHYLEFNFEIKNDVKLFGNMVKLSPSGEKLFEFENRKRQTTNKYPKTLTASRILNGSKVILKQIEVNSEKEEDNFRQIFKEDIIENL